MGLTEISLLGFLINFSFFLFLPFLRYMLITMSDYIFYIEFINSLFKKDLSTDNISNFTYYMDIGSRIYVNLTHKTPRPTLLWRPE